MAAFEYQAIDGDGKTQRGLIEADTARQARQQLRGMSLMPLEIGEVTSRQADGGIGKAKRDKINVATLSLITRQLATLISAGQPVESAYHAVSRQTPKPAAKHVLLAVRARVLEGYPLSEALREFPRIFDSMYCASVHAGESSGLLDIVMERLADHMEARQDLQRRTGQALIYPILLSVVAFALVGALLTFVVPKIVQVFEGFDTELPLMTTWLIAISDFFKDYGVELLIGVVLAVAIYAQLVKLPGFRRMRDRFYLRLPYISYLVRLANTARFTRTMSILVSSGVTALDAMRISTEVINSEPIRAAVIKAADKVREGEYISTSLDKTGYFSPLVIQLVQNGEASGKLGEMMERSARAEENEFGSVTAMFIALFEPAMILLMGMVVLFIVIAILIPIFDMNELV
ncbi:MAG: type II secretion system inner membrane protein GspF [Gammaproteobacteria bacterium]|nr:type II secretion system inner membrane protein GspF [Gammaproteobacteria bacterium]MDH3450357.1 type II secretion system inner membrane protein GspF [Gammaproteobacteria bacterium]